MFQAGPPDSTERFEDESDYLPELDAAEALQKISPEFATILRKCLMLRAKERYQSVSELKVFWRRHRQSLLSRPRLPQTIGNLLLQRGVPLLLC